MVDAGPVESYLAAGKALKKRLVERESVFGIFVKTVDAAAVEILCQSGFDFLVLDAEHRAFPDTVIDACVLVGRIYSVPIFIRLPDHAPASINRALDQGALGLFLPTVSSAQEAAAIVAAARYQGGQRGFSPSTPANGFGVLAPSNYRAAADEAIGVVVQVETRQGLDAIDEISATPGIDGVFVGPMDLANSLDELGGESPKLTNAIQSVLEACGQNNMPSGVFCPTPETISTYQSSGASFFVVSTDQSLLRGKANSVIDALNKINRKDTH